MASPSLILLTTLLSLSSSHHVLFYHNLGSSTHILQMEPLIQVTGVSASRFLQCYVPSLASV